MQEPEPQFGFENDSLPPGVGTCRHFRICHARRVARVRQELTAILGHKALVSNKRQQQRYKLKPTSKDDFTDSRTRNSRNLSIGLKLLLV